MYHLYYTFFELLVFDWGIIILHFSKIGGGQLVGLKEGGGFDEGWVRERGRKGSLAAWQREECFQERNVSTVRLRLAREPPRLAEEAKTPLTHKMKPAEEAIKDVERKVGRIWRHRRATELHTLEAGKWSGWIKHNGRAGKYARGDWKTLGMYTSLNRGHRPAPVKLATPHGPEKGIWLA